MSNLHIDPTLNIPRDSGFKLNLSYSCAISFEMEAKFLDIVHANHGLYFTNFVGNKERTIVYWFKTKKTAYAAYKQLLLKSKLEKYNINLDIFDYNKKNIENLVINNNYGLFTESKML